MSADPDQVFEVARPAILRELRDALGVVRADDFTMRDLIALANILTPAYERHQAAKRPPGAGAVLKLVPRPRRKRD